MNESSSNQSSTPPPTPNDSRTAANNAVAKVQQEPATVGQPEQQVAVVPPAKKRGTLPWMILVGVVILALIGGTLWLYMQNQSLNDSLTSTKQQLGITKASLDISKKDADSAKAELAKNTETAAEPKTDEEQIVATTSAWAHSYKGSEKAKLTITVTTKQLPFAQVSVHSSEEMSGYACVLKKTDSIWLVLFCGQQAPNQTELDKWGVPASVVASLSSN